MFKKPGYTNIPNEFFDQMIPSLKEGEMRVLLVIMRQTFGWGNKEWDRISISQLMQKTGMERMAVVRSTKSLIEKKLVVKHKSGAMGQEQCWYSLMVEEPTEFNNPIDDSNNCYQYPKDTPPSILKIPTKETLTKEIKESSLKGAKEKSPAAPPPPSGVYKNEFEGRVIISEENYQRLKEKFGSAELIKKYAEKLYRWSFNNEKEFRKKKRHDMVIEDWIEKDLEKNRKQGPSETGLNAAQKKNWEQNQDLVNELKIEAPEKAAGLNIFYKHYVLKDRNNPAFDVSCLIDHKDFCRVLGKHLKLNIYQVRFPNG